MRILHRARAAPWREIAALVLLACSGGASTGNKGVARPDGGAGSQDGGPQQGATDSGVKGEVTPDGGEADGGPGQVISPDVDGGLDGGLVFVSEPAGPDASNWCAGGPVGGSRSATVRTPTGYDCASTTWPLVILLHDYGSSGDEAEAYFQIAAQADSLGFLYVHPDGTTDSQGNEFWNATDACCNVDDSAVSDSSYLDTLIVSTVIQYNADESRVFVFGYGNGGFMAYRLACDHASDVTAVADFGGATWDSASECSAKAPISALEIHGTNDATFLYGGGTNLGAPYPSAPDTIGDWVGLRHCEADAGAEGAGLELLDDEAGTDTAVVQWPCVLGREMALWTIQGGTHEPSLAPSFTPAVLGFLLAQKKP
jgi:polyhydroxybutyrate depolymerase